MGELINSFYDDELSAGGEGDTSLQETAQGASEHCG